MLPADKRRLGNALGDQRAAGLAEAPTVRADDEVLNTLTAEGAKRANPFRALDAAATAPAMPSVEPGTVVKHYEFIRQLGAGGMGTVFLARDTRLGRLVAVKLLLNYTGPAAYRFLAEARTTAQCRHENIVVIYDVDEYNGYPYMVLEYIEGRTLRAAMADPGRDVVTFAIESMISVTRALVRAHEMNIVHRDLKPENILLSKDGQIKVLDFGIAKQVSEVVPEPTHPGVSSVETNRPEQTQAGALVGTLGYMSPEQIRGESIDARTDIWAVGVMLYEMVAGERPIRGDSFTQVMAAMRATDAFPSVREKRPELGPLADIVDRCLQLRKDDRFESAKELLVALERVGEGKTKRGIVSDERASADVQTSNSVTLPEPDTFDAVVPEASLRTGDPKEVRRKDAKPTTDTPGKTKRFGWAHFGGMGLVAVAFVAAGVVWKQRETPQPVAPTVVVSSMDCSIADVTGNDVPAGFADALGKGACARLGIELGVPWHVAGATRLGVRADVRGKDDAHVTLELSGKTAEGTGKTPIQATNDAIQKLAPMISVPPFSPERIVGWGAKDEASARRIERGFRRFAFGFAERESTAEALLQTDPDSALPHALVACVAKNHDPQRARAEKEEARKRYSSMNAKRAKLIAGEMAMFIPTDDKDKAADMVSAYSEMATDPDFAGLYSMCGCILTTMSLPMVDWLSKNEPIMGLPVMRCGQALIRDISSERQAQYLQWVGSTLPESSKSIMEDFLKLGKVDEARKALAIEEALGAETTRARELARKRSLLAFVMFDPNTALRVGDEMIGDPDMPTSHEGARNRILAFMLAGQLIAAGREINLELGRLTAEEDEYPFFELARWDLRLRRLLDIPALPALRMEVIRDRLAKSDAEYNTEIVPELAFLALGTSKEANAKAEFDRYMDDSDLQGRHMNPNWRTAMAFQLVRRFRGNEGAAAAYRGMETQIASMAVALEAGLVFEAIGSKAEAEKAYRLSMEEPWTYPFDAIAARLRLADMMRADGRADEARELMAIVDKAWVDADYGLRDRVRKLK